MKTSTKALVAASIAVALCLSGYAGLQLSKSRTFQFFGNLVSRVDTDQKVVALTFDDAPSEHTDEVLKVLQEKDVKATFFAIGQSLEKYPDQAKAIVQAGHELGNHTYAHKRMVFKSIAFIRDEIDRTNVLIRAAGYQGEIFFRPPNGKKLFGLPWYLHQNGIKTIMWDVEPDTYAPGDAQRITDYVLNNARPGSIILMHPFCDADCAADREALPKVIDGLKAKGYAMVTVDRLLSYGH